MMTLLLLAAGALPQSGLHAADLPDRQIRVGDIASAPGYEGLVIGALPQGVDSVVIDEAAARRLLRNRLPQRQFALNFKDRMAVRQSAADPANDRRCLRAASDLAVGEAVVSDNTQPTPCTGGRPVAGLGYDQARGLAFARQPIPSGAYLGPLRLKDSLPVPAGQPMTLRFAAGPVVVERAVVTLQPGVAGKRMFVKTEDNEVISAMVAAEDEGANP